MKIGIFASVAGRNDSGPETYEVSLIRNLALVDSVNEYHIFCFNKKAVEAINVSQKNFVFHVLWPSSRIFSLLFSLPISLYLSRVDFYHATFIPPPYSFKPYIMTMHGSDMFEHPEFFEKKVLSRLLFLLKSGLKHSSKIICVSQHVKKYLETNINTPKEKLEVIHHGVSAEFKVIERNDVKNYLKLHYKLEPGYFLFVGKLVEGKNISRLLAAFSGFIKKTNANVKLVLAGRAYDGMSAFSNDLENDIINEKVIRLGHVSHEELPYLFNGAKIFVFPSLWEGFGLPLIEAMACEIPTITSNVSCIPEIMGDSAIMVDPLSIEEIEQAMIELYNNNTLYTRLKKLSRQRSEKFTWEQTARETLAIYEGMLI